MPIDPDWPPENWHSEMEYNSEHNEGQGGFTRKGWTSSGTLKPHQFNIVAAPYPVRYGLYSERFEIRSDDDDGMTELTQGNRSELTQRPSSDNPQIGQDSWIGWSFYYEDLPRLDGTYGWNPKFGQWKTDLDGTPVISLTTAHDGRKNNEGGWIAIELTDLASKQDRSWLKANYFGYPCRLFDIEKMKSSWIDITINTNFGDDENGYLKVWINDVMRCDYKGQIVVTPVKNFESYGVRNNGLIFKRGYWSGHRGFPSKWKTNHPEKPIPTFVVYYDEWRQGKNRADVDIRLIEGQGGAALD